MSLAFARLDYKEIIGQGEFSVTCTFTPLGVNPVSKSIKGVYAEHHNQIGTDGIPVNAKSTRLTICESDLTSQGYVTRNSKNRVSMTSHLVVISDITGIQRSYIVKEVLPDHGIGGITLILGDYGS